MPVLLEVARETGLFRPEQESPQGHPGWEQRPVSKEERKSLKPTVTLPIPT